MDWILKEAMEIELHTATMKRKDSYWLSRACKPFCRDLKEQRLSWTKALTTSNGPSKMLTYSVLPPLFEYWLQYPHWLCTVSASLVSVSPFLQNFPSSTLHIYIYIYIYICGPSCHVQQASRGCHSKESQVAVTISPVASRLEWVFPWFYSVVTKCQGIIQKGHGPPPETWRHSAKGIRTLLGSTPRKLSTKIALIKDQFSD
jgi:hypothetical protein